MPARAESGHPPASERNDTQRQQVRRFSGAQPFSAGARRAGLGARSLARGGRAGVSYRHGEASSCGVFTVGLRLLGFTADSVFRNGRVVS